MKSPYHASHEISCLFLQLTTAVTQAQSGKELLGFKRYAESISIQAGSNTSIKRVIKDHTEINYLAPLAEAFSHQQSLISHHFKDGYYRMRTQHR